MHLTFDVDWAPDAAVEDVLDLLKAAGVRATFMVTHPSVTVDRMTNEGHEVGVHPNFLPGSSHGKTVGEIMSSVLAIAPRARVMRTHALVQSSPLLYEIFQNSPSLTHDLSVFTYKTRQVCLFDWQSETIRFKRMTYNWEDDTSFFGNHNWHRFEPFGESMVLNFHPIHVALNSADTTPYSMVKANLNGLPLTKAPTTLLAQSAHQGPGTRTFLQSVLDSNSQLLSFEEFVCALG